MKKAILFFSIVCLLVLVFAGYKIASELRMQKEEINDFNELAERYFLTLTGDPSIRVAGDKVTVTFHINKDE